MLRRVVDIEERANKSTMSRLEGGGAIVRRWECTKVA